MGVSTSGSLLVIFFGAFIALGTAYTVAANTTDDFTDAYSDELATQDAIAETDISVDAVYHEVDGNLTVRADNDGSTDLAVSETDVLVDGAFRPISAFEIRTVDDRDTDRWQTGEQLRLENESAEADRVKLVTGSGVAATARVKTVDLLNGSVETLDRTGSGNESTISFDLESTYTETVTLVSVRVDAVEDADPTPTTINYTNDDFAEVNVTVAPEHGQPVATTDGTFDIDETIPHDPVELAPNGEVRYHIGEFRDDEDEPVDMPDTTVTITVTFEDPHGVERTFTFEESEF